MPIEILWAWPYDAQMDKFIEWLNAVVGRRVRLAESLGVKPPAVSEWVTGKRPVPIVHGAAIELFTQGQVTRQDLFPDDWQQIWPELAADTNTNTNQTTHEGQGA